MIDLDVERILKGPPSERAFRALCALLAEADESEELFSVSERLLASWPDSDRAAPWSWVAALNSGHPKKAWALVRSLDLRSERCGTREVALPDPRVHAEVLGVTRLDLAWYDDEQLAALVETFEHWPDLRLIRIPGLTGGDEELVAELGRSAAVRQLESLNLIDVRDDLFHFKKPPFRPVAGPPWRLRHAGMRAPDLAHLLRSGLAPRLRSADVLVCDVEEARALAECDGLARLDRLAIGFRCGHDGRSPLMHRFFGNVIEQDESACEAFFAQADLANLRSLRVLGRSLGDGREGLGDRGVDALRASGVLSRLTELSLELLPIGDATIAKVVAALDPERVASLALTDLVATDVTADALCAANAFPRLRHLDLSRNVLGEKGAQRLAADVRMPSLEYLDLSGRGSGSPYYGRVSAQPIGDGGAAAWARSENATALTTLKLAATGLGADGFAALMTSDRLRKLRTLDVSENPGGAWPETIPTGPLWRTLQVLDVSEFGLGDCEIEALTKTDSAPCLRAISLAYNSVGTSGARALASWPVLPQLWELNLHDNIIGDDGLIGLAASGNARRLLELDLEQDCWNAHARKPGPPLPAEITEHASFPSLDAMFLGEIDEYHGARYSSGFPAQTRESLASATTTRPELVAFLTHLELECEEPDDPGASDDPDAQRDRADHDFRTERLRHHLEGLAKDREFARRMIAGDLPRPHDCH